MHATTMRPTSMPPLARPAPLRLASRPPLRRAVRRTVPPPASLADAAAPSSPSPVGAQYGRASPPPSAPPGSRARELMDLLADLPWQRAAVWALVAWAAYQLKDFFGVTGRKGERGRDGQRSGCFAFGAGEAHWRATRRQAGLVMLPGAWLWRFAARGRRSGVAFVWKNKKQGGSGR